MTRGFTSNAINEFAFRLFIIYLETKFHQNRRIFVFCRSFWNGHHSKPTMNINSQHHNLLGNHISSISEDFCIWWPFYTLVTMATAAILNLFNPPPKAATYYGGYSYKVDHNMTPKPWISIPNIIIYLETKFRQIGGLLYLVAILYLGYHGNGRYFEFFQPPNSCHTLRWIFLQSFMKFDERYPNKI